MQNTVRHMIAVACTAVFGVYAALPVSAQVDPNTDPLISVEVLDGGKTANGTYMAALRLTLQDGWKTYWRAPGDAGIPPQFNWRGSRNIAAMAITWPAPTVFSQNGMQSIGYENQLVLPLEITPTDADQPMRLKGAIELGVCKDVCIPGQLQLSHDLDASAGRNPAIAAALAQRPFSASEGGVTSATCHMSPIDGGFRVQARIAMPSAGGTEVAVIEPGNSNIWASETATTRSGGTLTATSDLFHTDSGAIALDRSKIRITVLGSKHAVDIRGCDAG